MPRLQKIAALSLILRASAQDCNDPGYDPNASRVQLNSGRYLYTCNTGFSTPDFSPDIQLSCEGGLWGPVNPPSMEPLCVASDATTMLMLMETAEETTAVQSCSDPGQAANADRISDHFEHGAEVYFTCNPGFCAAGHRARTIILQCRVGQWSQSPPECQPCEMCSAPEISADKYVTATLNEDFTATLTCDDGYVMKAGTDITDMTLDCIEGGNWADDTPTCSVPSQVVCGEDYITVVINKNLLVSQGFSGGVDSIALTGRNQDVSYIDDECFAEIDDSGENYLFSMFTPFTDRCRTEFEIESSDIVTNYRFSNKVVWKQNNGAVTRQTTILDFECVYEGMFVTSLQRPIKLAISTRTYYDESMEPFTISMAIYHQRNYTGLVDNVPILHRGKRYFIELLLHEEERGTPFLSHCYGSSSFLSEAELSKLGTASRPDQLRTMLENGCPAARTLVRLEVPPNESSRRFSFMFPKISVGIAELQFVYIHCEVELKDVGHKPQCFRQNDYTSGGNRGVGRRNNQGGLGSDQFFLRAYGGGNRPLNDPNRLNNADAMANDWMHQRNSANNDMMNMLSDYVPQNLVPDVDPNEGKRLWGGRKKRSLDNQHPVSFGPIIFPEDDEESEDDILENFADDLPDDLFVGQSKQMQDMEKVVEEIAVEIEKEMVDEEIQQEEESSGKTIMIVVCMLVAGLVVFIISMVVGLNSCCFFGTEKIDEKKVSPLEKQNSGIPEKILSGNMKELNEKIKAQYTEESCNTSVTTADSE